MKIRLLIVGCLLLLGGCVATPVNEIYLLRHAEKQTGDDPALTQAGQARAAHVAGLLQSLDIRAVYSTDYVRTRQTAAPIAKAAGVPVTLYDPRQPATLVEQVRAASGNQVIVGHSNTIPDLVERLGGESRGPISESEYSRLYRLRLDRTQTSTEIIDSTPP